MIFTPIPHNKESSLAIYISSVSMFFSARESPALPSSLVLQILIGSKNITNPLGPSRLGLLLLLVYARTPFTNLWQYLKNMDAKEGFVHRMELLSRVFSSGFWFKFVLVAYLDFSLKVFNVVNSQIQHVWCVCLLQMGKQSIVQGWTKLADNEKWKDFTLSMLGTRSWSFLIRSLILVLLTCTWFKSIWDPELILKRWLREKLLD